MSPYAEGAAVGLLWPRCYMALAASHDEPIAALLDLQSGPLGRQLATIEYAYSARRSVTEALCKYPAEDMPAGPYADAVRAAYVNPRWLALRPGRAALWCTPQRAAVLDHTRRGYAEILKPGVPASFAIRLYRLRVRGEFVPVGRADPDVMDTAASALARAQDVHGVIVDEAGVAWAGVLRPSAVEYCEPDSTVGFHWNGATLDTDER